MCPLPISGLGVASRRDRDGGVDSGPFGPAAPTGVCQFLEPIILLHPTVLQLRGDSGFLLLLLSG